MSEKITLYLPPGDKAEIESEADGQGLSTSEYCKRMIRAQRRKDATDRFAAEADAERRIGDLLAEGRDELRDAADDVQDLTARGNIYAVALWELLKQDYPDAKRRDALSVASKRLRADAEGDDHGALLDALDGPSPDQDRDVDGDADGRQDADSDETDDGGSGSGSGIADQVRRRARGDDGGS